MRSIDFIGKVFDKSYRITSVFKRAIFFLLMVSSLSFSSWIMFNGQVLFVIANLLISALHIKIFWGVFGFLTDFEDGGLGYIRKDRGLLLLLCYVGILQIIISIFLTFVKILSLIFHSEYFASFISLILIFCSPHILQYYRKKNIFLDQINISVYVLRIIMLFLNSISTAYKLNIDFFKNNYITDAVLVTFAIEGFFRAYRNKNDNLKSDANMPVRLLK